MSSSTPTVARHTQTSHAVFSTTLLLHIFTYFCDAVHIPFRREDPRIFLSLICKRWAYIVRSSPCLWDTMLFSAPPDTTVYPEDFIVRQFTRLCTERCGQNSLNLSVDWVIDGWTFSFIDSVIIPYIERIRSLRCLIYGAAEAMQFLTMQGRFSALESLEILFLNAEDAQGIITLPLADSRAPLDQTSALITAPRLHKATMHFPSGLRPDRLPLPWGQLTSLDLGTLAISPGACIELMDLTALRLIDAFLYVEFIKLLPSDLVLWKRKITMETLRTLRLRLLFPSADTRIFSLLRFPSLQNLWIQLHDTFQHWDLPLYTKLLQASPITLRQLLLSDFYSPGFGMMPEQSFSDKNFVAQYRQHDTTHHALELLLKVIRNVEELHLPVSVHVDAHTVEEIASCALLPRLHSLDLGTLDGWPIIFMARRRRAQAFNIPRTPPGPSGVTAPLRRHIIYSSQQRPETCIRAIHMLIPRSAYSEEQRRALIEAAQALRQFSITCCVQTTSMLPLP